MLLRLFRLAALALTALTAVPAFAGSADAADSPAQVTLERWRSYAGVSWEPSRQGADPAPFAGSVNAPIAGIHFDARGRTFVSTPRLVSADAPATLSVLDTAAQSGPARLSAFPSADGNAVDAAPDTHLRNVLGFHVDRRNGWLWALDMGFVAGQAEAPAGAQKVMVYDLRTGRTVRRIALDGVADRKGSFLNDIVVDERRRIAYISDSGLRSAPDNQAGLIVVDFAAGKARRVLDRHASLLPEAGAKVVSHGAEVWPGNPLKLGINGIALSPDGGTLYWAVTTGTHIHAAPTRLLRDQGASPESLAAAVRDLGDVGGNTDGIVTDAKGNLYITDVTRNGIVKYDPATGTMSLLAADEGVFWPDTPALLPNGDLVFTASHLNGHFAGAVKAGEERYELWRLPLHRTSGKRD
ncbi:major royal jelly family protein [Cupriavidus gilardii]|uniref:Major royal jelly family protein n=1 Tax=Cupriavidus gilardii TaxID=82541 RepID=A0ABY4VR57_9BURK|nr:major royal jelly family protein [Cupriavidus gilardii]USE77813.1 major royal jelly family protein [Cupriavidus gilardii]